VNITEEVWKLNVFVALVSSVPTRKEQMGTAGGKFTLKAL
jgi:hypothetical protein